MKNASIVLFGDSYAAGRIPHTQTDGAFREERLRRQMENHIRISLQHHRLEIVRTPHISSDKLAQLTNANHFKQTRTSRRR